MILKNGKESKYHGWYPENERIARRLFNIHAHTEEVEKYNGAVITGGDIIYYEADVQKLITDILKGKYDKTGYNKQAKGTRDKNRKLLPKKQLRARRSSVRRAVQKRARG